MFRVEASSECIWPDSWPPPPKPRLMTSSRDEEQPLLDRVQHLELELNLLKSQLSDWQHLRTSCEQVSEYWRLLP